MYKCELTISTGIFWSFDMVLLETFFFFPNKPLDWAPNFNPLTRFNSRKIAGKNGRFARMGGGCRRRRREPRRRTDHFHPHNIYSGAAEVRSRIESESSFS